MRSLISCVLLVMLAWPLQAADRDYGRCTFPIDRAVLDAQRDLGAKGDGVTDDTAALQHGLDLSSRGPKGEPTRVLFLPNGTYRITKSLVVSSRLGPWLYGESRDGVILKLDDGVKDCSALLRTHPSEKGPTSADWFMRNIRNLTLDVGNNPDTDGIRFHATNTGIIRNVRVMGRGKIGIHSGFIDQSGPNLIQDVIVEGFETGILSQWIWSETLSRVTIRNCRKTGLEVAANVVAAENLTIENTPLPVFCNQPNDWYWWSGVVAIVGGRITGQNPDGPAILNKGVLYVRDLKTSGYKFAIEKAFVGQNAVGPDVEEYHSHPVKRVFDSPATGLRLPIRSEPIVPWELDTTKWVCANDFGATPGDNTDDTAAIQKAIDAAAAAGKTTVFFRGIGGGDPNWYTLNGTVRVHGSVRHILGLGFGRILGGKEGRFLVGDDAAAVVKFQNIDSFGGPPVIVENRSASRTMLVESCGVTILGTGTGDIFVTDCPAGMELRHPGQNVWCRQLNPEGTSDIGLVRNAGANLWILGMKCEGAGIRVATSQGGKTEVFGTFIYGPGLKDKNDPRPIFDVDNGSLSVHGLRELNFGGHSYWLKVREKRGLETKTFGVEPGHGWIGWSTYSGWAK